MRSRLPALVSGLVVAGLLAIPSSADAAVPGWLKTLNEARTGSGLHAVSANTSASLITGMKHHVAYMKLDKRWMTGAYASMHTENPAAPHYTADGAYAASHSVIASGTHSGTDAVNAWLMAPLHAAAMLKPNLTSVAFYRDPKSGRALMNVNGGISAGGARVLYPGAGATVHMVQYWGEFPDPSGKSCPAAYGAGKAGLPIFAKLPSNPTSHGTSTLTGPNGKRIATCTVDRFNYVAADPVYGPTGAADFNAGMVIIFPHTRLRPGTYKVHLAPGGQSAINWSFHSKPTAMPPRLGYQRWCSYTNPKFASGKVKVLIRNLADTTHATKYRVKVGHKHRAKKVGDGKTGKTKAFKHLRAGKHYTAKVHGSDHTGGKIRFKITACAPRYGIRAGRWSWIAKGHQILQPIDNRRNRHKVKLTVHRSGMSTLHMKVRGKSKRTLHIPVRHGKTKLRFTLGGHKLFHYTIRWP